MSDPVKVSHSRMNMLSRCGEQYRYRYIEGRRSRPGVSLLVGTAVDRAVTSNLRSKIDAGELLEVEEVDSIARDALEFEWNRSEIQLHDEEVAAGVAVTKGAAVDKSVRLAHLHAATLAPAINPTHVDRGFVLEIEEFGVEVRGWIDIQEGTGSVRDTKTTGKTPSADIADKSAQLDLYALAATFLDEARRIPEVALDYLIDLKKGARATSYASVRNEETNGRALARIERFVLSVASETYLPTNPDSWWCAAKWCGYYDICKFAARPVTVAVPPAQRVEPWWKSTKEGGNE